MNHRILFVDDEPNILSAIKRLMRGKYDVATAASAEEAHGMLDDAEPYAVVVSDLRMPGTDGIEFLEQVRTICPESVRVMLTGQADLQAAMEAINCSQIFRFITKPVAPDSLREALDAAAEQHRLIVAERELLEQTLTGSVRALTDVLELVNPVAFGRSTSIRAHVTHAARALGAESLWEYELAAMLSHVGCVALPAELVERVLAGQEVDEAEASMFRSHPRVAEGLLEGIPRLETVAKIVASQLYGDELLDKADPRVALGARLIRLASIYEGHIRQGLPAARALEYLKSACPESNGRLAEAFRGICRSRDQMVVRTVSLAELKIGMLLDEDVLANNGLLIMTSGQEVTSALLERLRNFARGIGISEPIRVRIPAAAPALAPA